MARIIPKMRLSGMRVGILLAVSLLLSACEYRADLPAPPVTFDIIGGPQGVFVKGFCHLEFEGNGLYPSRDDAVARRDDRGYSLDLDRRKWAFCHGQTVIIHGDFDARHRGHEGSFPRGGITNIRTITVVGGARNPY